MAATDLTPTDSPRASRGWERGLVLLLAALMALFYWWTMASTKRPWYWGDQKDYYNLLVHGWLDGHLHMKVDVPEALLKIADPYDPAQRPAGLGLHDATFYNGKYYIYFGVAPAAVLMLPFRVITGMDLPSAVAVWVFVTTGFFASVAVWWQVRVRYFPTANALMSGAGVVMLGLGGLGTVLLRRPSMYELAISSGYCFAMIAVWCGFRALHAERRAGWWMAAASLAAGLAVGSRPSYVVAAPAMILPLLAWFWFGRDKTRGGGSGKSERPWGIVAAGVLPLAACGMLLALHNYLRFGSPTEFGVRYMFSGIYESKATHFSPAYFLHNFWCYFLSTPRLLDWFPFMERRDWPAGPAGYMAGDGYYGVLPTMPILILGPIVLGMLWWRREEAQLRLRLWLTGVLLLGGGVAALLCGFYSSAGRYQVDFAPALMLAACVGALVVEAKVRETCKGAMKWFRRGLLGALALWSALFALMLSFQANNEFRGHNVATFRAVAKWFNLGPSWVRPGTVARYGPVEMRVKFPEGRTGHKEPLVTTGVVGRGNFLFVEYLDATRVRLGYDNWGTGTIWSEPFALDRAVEHQVQAIHGALAGPGILGKTEVVPFRRLRVMIDGRVVWENNADFYPAEADEIHVGTNPLGGTACEEKFTGTISQVKHGG